MAENAALPPQVPHDNTLLADCKHPFARAGTAAPSSMFELTVPVPENVRDPPEPTVRVAVVLLAVANPENGNPVALVRVPDAGVPSAGVTNVGEVRVADVAKTTLPLPVLDTVLGTPVVVVLKRKPVANPERAVPLIWFALTTPEPVNPSVPTDTRKLPALLLVDAVKALNAAEEVFVAVRLIVLPDTEQVTFVEQFTIRPIAVPVMPLPLKNNCPPPPAGSEPFWAYR